MPILSPAICWKVEREGDLQIQEMAVKKNRQTRINPQTDLNFPHKNEKPGSWQNQEPGKKSIWSTLSYLRRETLSAGKSLGSSWLTLPVAAHSVPRSTVA